MFARLGHVIFIFAYIVAALIVLAGIAGIGWNTWVNGRGLLASIDADNWSPVGDWLVNVGIGAAVILAIAGVVFLVGLAICYVLGGFTTTVADQVRKNSK